MCVPTWVCLDCKKEFNPINKNGDFTFNCPVCGSSNTIAVINHEGVTESSKENRSE